ncbi:hypothetical protein GZ78_01595 [Endozoicomonas numazuensis]|uniref:Uncharacterized protein n=1 Tax=Endozoicomonas numazuensis TaxID=1137799 RepID=A0A081NK31_9GAMM|nr:hypothetical protein GZ78_01595 [Endozoicomonas numazuensis]
MIELNPNRPETINALRQPSARTFLWGGNGHWRCLVKNQNGGVDLLNDSTVTRNYFSSIEKMINHFNKQDIYAKRQIQLVTESLLRPDTTVPG